MTATTTRPVLRRVVAVLVLAVLTTGCPESPPGGVGIRNHSGVPLDFVYVTDHGQDILGTDVPPGRSYRPHPHPMPGRCAVGHIEARLPDTDTVVKRLDPPFCWGDHLEVRPEDIPPHARPTPTP